MNQPVFTVGLHLYFKPTKQARAGVGRVLEAVAAEFPQVLRFCVPNLQIVAKPTPRGHLARTVRAVQAQGSVYTLYNAEPDGNPGEHRWYVSIGDDLAELSVQLPLSLARDPDALAKRFTGYAEQVPCVVGHAGYSVAPRFECNGADGEEEVIAMLRAHLGVVASQGMLGRVVDATTLVPSWLTILGPAWAKRVKSLPKAKSLRVTTLPNRNMVIRSAVKPMWGSAKKPGDLGALPVVARALSGLQSRDEDDEYFSTERARFAQLLALA